MPKEDLLCNIVFEEKSWKWKKKKKRYLMRSKNSLDNSLDLQLD